MGQEALGTVFGRLVGPDAVERAAAEDALEALQLITVDEDGWAHVALLSAGEVAAVTDDRLALCLWRGSGTTRNLLREGRAVLHAVTRGAVVKANLAVEPLGTVSVGGTELQAFLASALRLSHDAVGYAEVLGGIRYRLTDVEGVVARWRAQQAALADAANPAG